MICLKQTKVTEWIISGNPEQYNVVDAFHNLHRVDWAQKANMTAGDIVYIYVSGNVKSIKFKCRVNKADLDEPDIDDREYDFSDQFDGTAGRYMELELIEEYVGDEYSREELMKHGFRSPQGPIRMPESVKQYLESISVFEHRYPVNTAVWIATALLSAEEFDSNPVCSKKDMYLNKQQSYSVHKSWRKAVWQMLGVRNGAARIMITQLIIISGEIPKKIVH